MGDTVKIRKRTGTFPESVAGFGGYVAHFNEQGVADVDPVHALHFLQFPNDYQVAKADAAKVPHISEYRKMVQNYKPRTQRPVVQQAPVDNEDFFSVQAGNVQPENFKDDDDDWFNDDNPVGTPSQEDDEYDDGDDDSSGDYVDPDDITDDEIANALQNEPETTSEFVCEGCGKSVKTAAGLATHQRTCKALQQA